MRKITILIFAVLGLALLGVFVFFVKPKSSVPSGGAGPIVGFNEFDSTSSALSQSDIPPGPKLTLGTPGGGVVVNNFYRDAVRIVERSYVVLREEAGYNVGYSRVDGRFMITILAAPVGENREAAERALLAVLGIGQSEACRLPVSVTVPVSVDLGLGGKTTGLSFCPPGVYN